MTCWRDYEKRSGKHVLFIVICAIIVALGYTACKEITPTQKRIEKAVELKLSK